MTCIDENGVAFDHMDPWVKYLNNPKTSTGLDINAARAIEIAMDAMDNTGKWTTEDIASARGYLAAIRAQMGICGPDAEALGHDDGIAATHQIDIWIVG